MHLAKYDVIIIGAGPSGASCAYNIKRFYPNAQVLLVDKETFPRYKPCGGGVSPQIARYLDFDLSPVISPYCSNIAMIAGGKEVATNSQVMWMVRREEFDYYLVKQAIAKGVEFLPATGVDKIEYNDDFAEVFINETSLLAKIVVIAEGSKGKLAKNLAIKPQNTVLAAMEYEHYAVNEAQKLFIDFDQHDNGYAWNFPKKDGMSLGIGGVIKGRAKSKNKLPQKLKTYIISQFKIDSLVKEQLFGHPIEVFNKKAQLIHFKRIVLVGEITGCVDPLTAEGIRPAVKTGFLAAKAITASLMHDDLKLLNNYQQDFIKEEVAELKRAKLMAYFLNNYQKVVLPMIMNQRALTVFIEIFTGKRTYQEVLNIRRVYLLVKRVIMARLKKLL